MQKIRKCKKKTNTGDDMEVLEGISNNKLVLGAQGHDVLWHIVYSQI